MTDTSRNPISLSTVGSDESGSEYYDEAVAISQDAINENFRVLFGQQRDLAEIAFRDRMMALQATIDAPQLKLSGDPTRGEVEECSLELRYSLLQSYGVTCC